jgi:hypothetical protein
MGDLESNRGTARVIGSQVVDNVADTNGGGILNLTLQDLYIDHSLIARNTADFGAAIHNASFTSESHLTITNSTISGNTVTSVFPQYRGGAIVGYGMTITHSTIAANVGGGVRQHFFVDDGAFFRLDFYNSVIVDNTVFDILAEDDAGTLYNSVTTTLPDPGSWTVEPLADNGGPTATHALLAANPLVNYGAPIYATLTDQRGRPRIVDRPDAGAFELVGASGIDFGLVVTTLSDENNGTSDPGVGAGTSLREAMNAANMLSGRQTISFAVGGTITLGGAQLPTITEDLDIWGPAAGITISGNDRSRVFQIAGGVDAKLSRLTVTDGNAGSAGGARS